MAVMALVLIAVAAASFAYAAWAWADVWNLARPKMFSLDETSARWGLESFVWSAEAGPEIRRRYIASLAALAIASGAVAAAMFIGGNGLGAGLFGLVFAVLAFTAARGISRYRAMLREAA